MSEGVQVEREGPVFTLRLNRLEKLNALDVPGLKLLRTELQGAATDPSIRAVVLTGAGKAFCAGGDLADMETYLTAGRLPELFHEMTGEQELAVREIMTMAKPVVASLPGVAAGGGLSLALAADWRIASSQAFLYPAFPALGAIPDGGLTYLLPHYLGIGLTQEMLFANSRVSADRARELGLVHEVVAPERLAGRTTERAKELAEGPTFAYGWMKHLLVSAFSQSLEGQLALERRGAVEAARKNELPEGIRSLRKKTKPTFRSDGGTS